MITIVISPVICNKLQKESLGKLIEVLENKLFQFFWKNCNMLKGLEPYEKNSFENNLSKFICKTRVDLNFIAVLSRTLSGLVAIFASMFLHNDNTRMDFDFLNDIIYCRITITLVFQFSETFYGIPDVLRTMFWLTKFFSVLFVGWFM